MADFPFLASGLFGTDEGIYGSKPVVPEFDPYASFSKTIKSNIALEPQAQQLASLTNKGNQDQLTAMIESLFPAYRNDQAQIQSNLSHRIRGELSPDVVRNIQDQGAIWGQQSGVGLNNPQVDFRDLRNYGLTSMATQRQGEADTQGYLGFLRNSLMPSPLDIRDYSINPAQANTDEWNRDWLAAQVAGSPDPAERGQYDSRMAVIGMLLSAYGGGAGYTGQYKSPYQGGGSTIGGGTGDSGGGFGRWWTNTFGGGNRSPSAVQTHSYYGGDTESGPYY